MNKDLKEQIKEALSKSKKVKSVYINVHTDFNVRSEEFIALCFLVDLINNWGHAITKACNVGDGNAVEMAIECIEKKKEQNTEDKKIMKQINMEQNAMATNFNREKLKEFKEKYESAQSIKGELFIFEGHEYTVGYAKFLIEFLETKLKIN